MRKRTVKIIIVVSLMILGIIPGIQAAESHLWTEQFSSDIKQFAISNDGEYIAAIDDHNLYLIDENGQELWSQSITTIVNGVAISGNGDFISVGSYRRGSLSYTSFTSLYDNTGQLLWSQRGGYSVAISNDGQHIVSCGGGIYLFHYATNGTLLWRPYSNWASSNFDMSTNGRYVVTIYAARPRLYDLTNKKVLYRDHSHYATLTSAVVSNEGPRLVVGGAAGYDGTHNIYNYDFSPEDDFIHWTYRIEPRIVPDLAISENNYVAIAGGISGIYVIDITRGYDGKWYSAKPYYIWKYYTGHRVNSVSISSDGQYVAAGGEDNTIRVIDNTGNVVWDFVSDAPIKQVEISYDGNHVAAIQGSKLHFFLTNPPENEAPIADAGLDCLGFEGEEIKFSAIGSSDPDNDELQYRWDLDGDNAWDTEWSANPVITHTWNDDYSGQVSVEAYFPHISKPL